MDACHSGSASQTVTGSYSWSESDAARNILFIMACRPSEYSYENPWLGNGYFTKALLKGIRGKADRNGDKQITIAELYKYIYGDVTERSKSGQHPQLIGQKSLYGGVIARW